MNGKTLEKVAHTKEMESEMVRTPFKYQVIDPTTGALLSETPMELWAGFIGAQEYKQTNMVTPKIGWMVRVTETDEETLKQLEKLNKEWGIVLRVKDVPEVMKELKHIKSLELEFTDEVTLPDWFFDADIKSLTIRGKMAKDAFLLSFALVGINTVDLYHLKKGDLKDGVLTYCRAKTDSKREDKALMSVRVEPEAAAIIERRKGMVGNLLMFATRYGTDSEFNRAMNIGLKEVGKLCKIEKLTTYHARHTWATLARNEVGVTLGDVGEALNHSPRGSERVTDIYVERDFSRVWETNRKVLDLVFGK